MLPTEHADQEMNDLLIQEAQRQQDELSLIPSENYVSRTVREVTGSVITNKYAEGYPGKRYYAGNEIVDKVETLVQMRAQKLFNVPFVNVEAYSGSPANLAVYLATCEPGDVVMGLDLSSGGHLTHGWKNSITGQFWKSVPYHVTPDGQIDFDELARLAKEHKPKLIWCGGTALPRTLDFARFAAIAHEVGAILAADISHIAGLIVGGEHPSPVDYAHIVTTTTHKTLRGPRGALIMVTHKGLQHDATLGEKIDRAILPGLQGGPHENVIAAIGVALHEAAQPAFKTYAQQIVKNARALADALQKHQFTLVSGGTDNHLLLLDLTSDGPGRGAFLHLALERIGLTTNKNTIPNEPSSPFYPSGLRLGTPAATTRGMQEQEMQRLADWIKQTYDYIKHLQLPVDKLERAESLNAFKKTLNDDAFYAKLRTEVTTFCGQFPVPK